MNETRQSQASSATESSDLLDYPLIGDYVGFVLRSALRHRVRFAVCFLAVIATAGLLFIVLPVQYHAQATLLAQRNPIMGTLSNPTVNRDGDLPSRAAREVVMRRENLVGILQQTDFIARHMESRSPISRARDWLAEKVTGRKPTSEELLDAFADSLATKLWVTVSQEGTVMISFVWSNPDLAYRTVEAAVQAYLEARHAAEVNTIGETIAILEARDAAVRKEAVALSNQLSEKERTGRRVLARPPAGSQARRSLVADEELTRLEATLAARRRALADLEEFRRRRLDDLQAQLAQQSNVYAPQHPIVESTRKSIESLSASSPQVDQLRAEVQELEAEVREKGGVVSARPLGGAAPLPGEPPARVDDGEPVLDYERNQLRSVLRQHANLLERIDSARVELETAMAAFKYRYSVISPPQFPKKPMRPYGLFFLVGGVLGGIAFGFLATTLADLRGGRIVERWQVERRLQLPVLAEPRREA